MPADQHGPLRLLAPWPIFVLMLLTVLNWSPCYVSAMATNPFGAYVAGYEDPAIGDRSGLTPRWYQPAVPAVPAIARRDEGDVSCNAGYHSCFDINSTMCCTNDNYCMIDPRTNEAACCAIGSTCDSPCSDSQYQCVLTTSVTVTATTVITETQSVSTGAKTTSALLTQITKKPGQTMTVNRDACCPRHCPSTSSFRCAVDLGGGCCHFGQTCGPSSQCVWTASPSVSSSALVPIVPSGCTTSQIACPIGGGCCNIGHTCTVVTNQMYCARATPTNSGIVIVSEGASNSTGSGSLSAGAKAGIGVGSAVGASLLIGSFTWFCCLRRYRRDGRRSSSGGAEEYRQQQQANAEWSPLPGSQQPGQPGLPGQQGQQMRQLEEQDDVSPLVRSWRRIPLRRNTGESSVNGGVAAGSVAPRGGGNPAESVADTTSQAGGRLRGLAQDYYGPDAVPGPFTDPGTADPNSPHSPNGNGNTGGVPREPHGPHDIVAPVEIDSTAKAEMDASQTQGHPHPHPLQQFHGFGLASPLANGSTAAIGSMSLVGGSMMSSNVDLPDHPRHATDLDPDQMLDPNDEKGERERMAYTSMPRNLSSLAEDTVPSDEPPPPQYGPDPASVVDGHFELYGSEVRNRAGVYNGEGSNTDSIVESPIVGGANVARGFLGVASAASVMAESPIDRFRPALARPSSSSKRIEETTENTPDPEKDPEKAPEKSLEKKSLEKPFSSEKPTIDTADIKKPVDDSPVDSPSDEPPNPDAVSPPTATVEQFPAMARELDDDPVSPTSQAVSPLEARSRAVSNVSSGTNPPIQSPPPPPPPLPNM